MYHCYVIQQLLSNASVKGHMVFDTPTGPYREGQLVSLLCTVPRVKGNVSGDNLRLTIGNNLLNSTLVQNNDKTVRLTVSQKLYMDASLNGNNVTCAFTEASRRIQSRSFTINVRPG